jgi:hypothetical protein
MAALQGSARHGDALRVRVFDVSMVAGVDLRPLSLVAFRASRRATPTHVSPEGYRRGEGQFAMWLGVVLLIMIGMFLIVLFTRILEAILPL